MPKDRLMSEDHQRIEAVTGTASALDDDGARIANTYDAAARAGAAATGIIGSGRAESEIRGRRRASNSW